MLPVCARVSVSSCVCVCVCLRERDTKAKRKGGERERKWETERDQLITSVPQSQPLNSASHYWLHSSPVSQQ